MRPVKVPKKSIGEHARRVSSCAHEDKRVLTCDPYPWSLCANPLLNHGQRWQRKIPHFIVPICSMYGTCTSICPKNHPNVGRYGIHGACGDECSIFNDFSPVVRIYFAYL